MTQGEDLTLLGGDVELLGRLAAGSIGDGEEGRCVLRPALAVPGCGEHGAAGVEYRRPAQVGRHFAQEGECGLRGVARSDL